MITQIETIGELKKAVGPSMMTLTKESIEAADMVLATNGLCINTSIVVGAKRWCLVRSLKVVVDGRGLNYDEGHVTVYPNHSGFKDLTDSDYEEMIGSRFALVLMNGVPYVYYCGQLLGGVFKVTFYADVRDRLEVFISVSSLAQGHSPLDAADERWLKINWVEPGAEIHG